MEALSTIGHELALQMPYHPQERIHYDVSSQL